MSWHDTQQAHRMRPFLLAGHTSAPVPCPVLGSCTSRQATSPDWSIVGVLLLLLVLMFLLLLLEFVRVTGRCRRKLQSQEDDVIQLIEAVGLKVSMYMAFEAHQTFTLYLLCSI